MHLAEGVKRFAEKTVEQTTTETMDLALKTVEVREARNE